MLDSGAIDLGMLENRRVPAGWHHVEVGQDETVLCVSRKHPYASSTSVTAQNLDGLAMVVFGTNFLQRAVLDQLCKEAGVNFQLFYSQISLTCSIKRLQMVWELQPCCARLWSRTSD